MSAEKWLELINDLLKNLVHWGYIHLVGVSSYTPLTWIQAYTSEQASPGLRVLMGTLLIMVKPGWFSQVVTLGVNVILHSREELKGREKKAGV